MLKFVTENSHRKRFVSKVVCKGMQGSHAKFGIIKGSFWLWFITAKIRKRQGQPTNASTEVGMDRYLVM